MFIITAQSEAKQNAFHVEFFSRLQVRLMPIWILFSLSQAFGDLFRSSLDFMFHGRYEVVVLPGLCFESNFSLQGKQLLLAGIVFLSEAGGVWTTHQVLDFSVQHMLNRFLSPSFLKLY